MAERLLAVQGQDPRGARLAVRARTEGLAAADVDRALSEERSLLITWLNRGTLHLVRSEDYPLLQALTTPPLLDVERPAAAAGGGQLRRAERALETIERSLAEEGPLTRRAAARAARARRRADRAARPDPPALPGRRARDRGARADGRQASTPTCSSATGSARSQPVDRDAALAELARRYLVGHAPADDRDLARWAGLPLRDARAGLAAIAAELERARGRPLRPRQARRRRAELPPPRLLGAFDPLLLGWTSREEILGPHTHAGHRERPLPTLRDGRGPGGRDLEVATAAGSRIEPLGKVPKAAAAALDADAVDVERFLASA